MKDELIRRLKELDVIRRELVDLKHAGRSDYYVDIKKAYGYPDVLNLICGSLWEVIDKRTTCIAAGGYGGVSPATILSKEYDLKLTLIRDEPKKHGKGGWIDGHVPTKQDRVSIIDDVFTTGGSLKKNINVIKPTGAEILGCHVVVKRGEGKLEVPFSYLLTAEDLL